MENINFLIVGKPNSGKSTFYNTLNNKYLSPTGPESGLTKDIFKNEISILDTKFIFFDTPGLRRKNKIDDKDEIKLNVLKLELVEIEKEIFKTKDNPTREQVAEKLLEYLDKEVKLGTKVNHIMRHTVGLYHGQIGSKDWKRYLSDNMMARDSDFQKAKHIMTIVQNNEKANQISS